MYRITEYLGDYPLDKQRMWNRNFHNLNNVLRVAESVWEVGHAKKADTADYYVLVEVEDSDDPADWAPFVAYTTKYVLAGKELRDFLAKYEE